MPIHLKFGTGWLEETFKQKQRGILCGIFGIFTRNSIVSMKKILFVAITAAFFACNSKPTTEPEQIEAPVMEKETSATLHIPKEQLASEIDPVCQMSVAEEQADTLSHEGKLYGFCGKGCKDAFAENPAEFLK